MPHLYVARSLAFVLCHLCTSFCESRVEQSVYRWRILFCGFPEQTGKAESVFEKHNRS